MCGKRFPLIQPAVNKQYCSDTCRAKRLAQRRKGESLRFLSKKARKEYWDVMEQNMILNELCLTYEGMFKSQQTQIELLLENNKSLKQEIDYLRKMQNAIKINN